MKVTEDIAYANSLGIEVGGYDLIALTRQVEQQWMAVNQLEYPRQAFLKLLGYFLGSEAFQHAHCS